MKKPVYTILMSTAVFLLVTSILFGLLAGFNTPGNLYCGTDEPLLICGTISSDTNENTRLGSAVFNSNCAACHRRYNDATGPALVPADSTVLFHWLQVKKAGIDTSKIKELGIDYHRNTYGSNLDSLELVGLYEYLQ